MGVKDFKKNRETFDFPLSELHIPAGFHRIDSWGDIDELAKDVIEHGQHEPITVRNEINGEDKGFYIIAGERRYKAVCRANEKFGAKIETMIGFKCPKGLDVKDEGAIIAFQFSENKHEKFSPLERGIGFKKLVEKGWTIARIADLTAYSQQSVRDSIALANVEPSIRKKVETKQLRPTTAMALSKAPKKVKETLLLKSELNPEDKLRGKDVDTAIRESKEPVIPDSPDSAVNNLDNIVDGYLKNGWLKREDAVKSGTIGRYNSFAIIGTLTPPRKFELVGK
jgi:ParB/RepB/Spo0J family partition protein